MGKAEEEAGGGLAPGAQSVVALAALAVDEWNSKVGLTFSSHGKEVDLNPDGNAASPAFGSPPNGRARPRQEEAGTSIEGAGFSQGGSNQTKVSYQATVLARQRK